MSVWQYIRDIIAIILITGGLVLFVIEIYGVFRFSFVLNRMHAAAIGDTLALTFCLAGLMMLTGFSYTTAKFLLVVMFLWVSSPASSHLIAKFEVTTNESVTKYLKKEKLEED